MLERAPNDAQARSWLGRLLSVQGRFDEAIVEARRAVELDPQSVTRNSYLADIYYGARKFDDCIEQAHKTLNLDPDAWGAYRPLSGCYDAKGNYDEGAKALQRFWVLLGKTPSQRRSSLRRSQRAATGPACVSTWRTSSSSPSTRASPIGAALPPRMLCSAKRNRAFASLDRAYQEFDAVLRYLHEPEFDSLRDDPRWLTFITAAELGKDSHGEASRSSSASRAMIGGSAPIRPFECAMFPPGSRPLAGRSV